MHACVHHTVPYQYNSSYQHSNNNTVVYSTACTVVGTRNLQYSTPVILTIIKSTGTQYVRSMGIGYHVLHVSKYCMYVCMYVCMYEYVWCMLYCMSDCTNLGSSYSNIRIVLYNSIRIFH